MASVSSLLPPHCACCPPTRNPRTPSGARPSQVSRHSMKGPLGPLSLATVDLRRTLPVSVFPGFTVSLSSARAPAPEPAPAAVAAAVAAMAASAAGYEAPPTSVAKTESSAPGHAEVMYVRKETFIRTPVHRVTDVLTSILANEGHQVEFRRFAGRVESLLRAYYHKRFTRLLVLYTYFDPVNGPKALEQDGLVTEPQVVAAEGEFLGLLLEVLEKSSFRMLTEQQFRMATSSNFLLQLPVQVDLGKIDSSLLERFFLEHKDMEKGTPSFARHYAIFTRGYGTATQTGLFVEEKLNVLLAHLFRNTLGRLLPKKTEDRDSSLDKVRVALRKQRIGARPAGEGAAAGVSPALGAASPPQEAEQLMEPLTRNGPCAGPNLDLDFERLRLDSLPLSSKEWLKPTTIKEPTFENVFLLYRPALPSALRPRKVRRKRALSADGEAAQKALEKARLLHRPIVLRQFADIPMADLEIVFPEKKTPNLTPKDWATLLVTIIMGVAAIGGSLLQKAIDTTVLKAIAVLLVTYAGKVFAGIQEAQKRYQQALADIVYARQMDSGRGTLLNLFQQVIDQELKETIIAYFVLLTQGKATSEDLDSKCEDLISEEFQEDLDFDTSDACDKLFRLGIVSKDGADRFIAVTLRRANEILGTTTDEVVGGVLGVGK